jgi:integrase
LDDIDNDIYLTTSINSDYEVKPFTLVEIQKILDGCKHEAIRNFIKFGFWTGMRIGEIFALEWSDIDFDLELISVTKSSSVQGLIKAPKTKSGIREIEMTPKAKTALLAQLQITKNLSHKREYWKKALDKANVPYRNPHQMRHTFISYMLSIGNNPLILYRMVGHSDPTVMYKKYARFIRQNGGEKLLKII